MKAFFLAAALVASASAAIGQGLNARNCRSYTSGVWNFANPETTTVTTDVAWTFSGGDMDTCDLAYVATHPNSGEVWSVAYDSNDNEVYLGKLSGTTFTVVNKVTGITAVDDDDELGGIAFDKNGVLFYYDQNNCDNSDNQLLNGAIFSIDLTTAAATSVVALNWASSKLIDGDREFTTSCGPNLLTALPDGSFLILGENVNTNDVVLQIPAGVTAFTPAAENLFSDLTDVDMRQLATDWARGQAYFVGNRGTVNVVQYVNYGKVCPAGFPSSPVNYLIAKNTGDDWGQGDAVVGPKLGDACALPSQYCGAGYTVTGATFDAATCSSQANGPCGLTTVKCADKFVVWSGVEGGETCMNGVWSATTFNQANDALVCVPASAVSACNEQCHVQSRTFNFNDVPVTWKSACTECVRANRNLATPGVGFTTTVSAIGCPVAGDTACCDFVLHDAICELALDTDTTTCTCGNVAGYVCPTTSCSSSKKGLLGLLGLLGLIPLLLCSLLCCLLLACRRKKTERDVHFATFDPQHAGTFGGCSAGAFPGTALPIAGTMF